MFRGILIWINLTGFTCFNHAYWRNDYQQSSTDEILLCLLLLWISFQTLVKTSAFLGHIGNLVGLAFIRKMKGRRILQKSPQFYYFTSKLHQNSIACVYIRKPLQDSGWPEGRGDEFIFRWKIYIPYPTLPGISHAVVICFSHLVVFYKF